MVHDPTGGGVEQDSRCLSRAMATATAMAGWDGVGGWGWLGLVGGLGGAGDGGWRMGWRACYVCMDGWMDVYGVSVSV